MSHVSFKEHERVERVAREIIDVAAAHLDKYLVEHSEKTTCFKIKTSDSGKLPYTVTKFNHLFRYLPPSPAKGYEKPQVKPINICWKVSKSKNTTV